MGQLLQAVEAAQHHANPDVRQRAVAKAEQWRAVLQGMADGTLHVGSRTPVAQTPSWVTLEVAHGGFATGRYLAEGELRAHEQAALARLPDGTPGATDRERLNLYYASDVGRAQLLEALREDRYAVEVPEEAALLVVAWLLDEHHEGLALELLAELRPLMHRLRFYPRITERPSASSAGVHVFTAGAVAQQLRTITPQRHVAEMNATLAVWNPLYDALVGLWLTTVEGEPPCLEHRAVMGGWPCRVWPGTWTEAREAWLTQYEAAVREHGTSGRHHGHRSTFQHLLGFLRRCPSDASALSDVEVARLRHHLACAIGRHGLPDSLAARERREAQRAHAARPLHHDLAEVLRHRIEALPPNEGIAAMDRVVQPTAQDEHPRVPAGAPMPAHLAAKAQLARIAPVDELVALGVVAAAEVLAIVLPQITAQVAAAGIEDPTCAGLFARTYTAFRRRRSLLLLNLEHQVTVDELPWVGALQTFRRDNLGTATLARQTLRDVTLLAFEHFPHTILPNPLLREMKALSQRAGLEVPIVEEIAADIFMGTFTKKFSNAANAASRVLAGRLYARYYDLPAASNAATPTRLRWGKKTDASFAQRCASRAEEAGSGGSGVAKNGAILEQSQILTSYNLATLTHALGLEDELGVRGAALGSQALRWVVARHRRLPALFMPRLRIVKNTAYAWRQALFFLSFASQEQQRHALEELQHAVGRSDEATRARLGPAVLGLAHVLGGGSFDRSGHGPGGARRFLGWACGHHWMLEDRQDR